MEDKITSELAEKEFFDWCEANEIETVSINDDEAIVFRAAKNAFLKAIKGGRLIFDGIKVIYTVSKFSPEGFAGQQVNFQRPTGNAWLGMDGRKATEQMHKMQGAMSAMTGKDVGFFAKLDASDWSFFMKASSLFLS